MAGQPSFSRGLFLTATGQLVCRFGDPIDHYVSGWPVTIEGYVVLSQDIPHVNAPAAFDFDAPTASGHNVTLVWSASTRATVYLIYRDSVLIGIVPSGTLTYVDSVPYGTYEYAIVARNSTGTTASTPATQTIVVAGIADFRVTSTGDRRVTSSGDNRVTA